VTSILDGSVIKARYMISAPDCYGSCTYDFLCLVNFFSIFVSYDFLHVIADLNAFEVSVP
jgi:hypothetical protein